MPFENARRSEAMRLAVLARGMLIGPREQIAADYIDHALATLRDLDEATGDAKDRAGEPFASVSARPRATNRD